MQEAWLRLSRGGDAGVENLGGWLTTVTARLCLDALRARTARREESLEAGAPEPVDGGADGAERERLLADSVGQAMLVVLDTLDPAERVAFVLHDMFAIPFDTIAEVVGRTSGAARQLASRARRRVHGTPAASEVDRSRHREVVNAFLTASRDGDFEGLLALLDPDVVVYADDSTVETGAERVVRGAAAVAETFKGRARAALLALVDGLPGAVWMHGGRPRVLFAFTMSAGKIVEIELLSDPDLLREVELTVLDA